MSNTSNFLSRGFFLTFLYFCYYDFFHVVFFQEIKFLIIYIKIKLCFKNIVVPHYMDKHFKGKNNQLKMNLKTFLS